MRLKVLGPLINAFGPTCPSELQLPLNTTVADACTPIGWNFRGARSQAAEELQIALTTFHLPATSHVKDKYVWVVNDHESTSFSIARTWDEIRNRARKQEWTSNIWFKGSVPRHSFNFWIAHLDRLPTRQRLASWGILIYDSCCLCDMVQESRDHLLLRCEISESIWKIALQRLGYRSFLFHTWTSFMHWLSHRDSSCPLLLKRLVGQAVVYALWTERNRKK
ncbi:PREDICTED: uncharacterized protein LOC106337977 [Brassica oleracea var. oleracea]|uniref:uncharacterized protein LOC106337977 n=1 Tax=Brassica oleracea var. oleracea TaxID=109376 RepID=UPI0006A6D63C|nr:PREDICTED: uncharacterized protein LOC106337977 [Brassica oleracea var. oleracea]